MVIARTNGQPLIVTRMRRTAREMTDVEDVLETGVRRHATYAIHRMLNQVSMFVFDFYFLLCAEAKCYLFL